MSKYLKLETLFGSAMPQKQSSASSATTVQNSAPAQSKSQPVQTAQMQRTTVQQTPKIISGKLPGLSIKAIMNSTEETEKTEQEAIKVSEEKGFSEQDFIKEWKAYAKNIPEKKILASAILSCSIKLSGTTAEISVDSPIEENIIREERINILNWLRTRLTNGKIDFSTRINEQGENVKAQSMTERFEDLKKKNENFKKLAEYFGLEV